MAVQDYINTSIPTSNGSVGLKTQVAGQGSTVSGAALATGGVAPGNFVEPDIDDQLFAFKGDDTPLMQLMLKAKTVNVTSPEVEHYMIDEPKSSVTVTTAVTANTSQNSFEIVLGSEEQNIPQDYTTLLVPSVDGYSEDGQTKTVGRPLMLFVTGRAATGNPIVRAVNGPKKTKSDMYCTVPAIPANTEMVVLANAMYETQKNVAPDLIVPQPSLIYLQKRGMNQIISDYFESQRKHIPFSQALIAEQALTNFKTRCNRTLWAGRQSKFTVNTKEVGPQYVYTTEGVRWQFKREYQHEGKWTIEKIIALAKMFFTGEDVPKTAILLAGKNLLESIQCIDYSKHPEIQISTKTNPVGWEVTNFHTVFGDIEIKREPTLDKIGWSNSGALIGEDRLVHYKRVSDHEFNEKVEGEEATRKGLIVWDGLALKGSCHIWIDGEGGADSSSATKFVYWDDSENAPTTTAGTKSPVYYLGADCTKISAQAKVGTMWQYNGSAWVEYEGELY
jgi:hypothetical protein